MEERLTEHNKTGWFLKLDDPQNDFEARQQLMNKFKLACEKLGKVEDILEKYNIQSVDDLDCELQDRLDYECLLDECRQAEKDRNIFNKALDLMSCVLCNKSRTDLEKQLTKFTLRKEVIEFFKQQAEKEIGE